MLTDITSKHGLKAKRVQAARSFLRFLYSSRDRLKYGENFRMNYFRSTPSKWILGIQPIWDVLMVARNERDSQL